MSAEDAGYGYYNDPVDPDFHYAWETDDKIRSYTDSLEKKVGLLQNIIARNIKMFLKGTPEKDIDVYELIDDEKKVKTLAAKIYENYVSKDDYNNAYKILKRYPVTTEKRQKILELIALYNVAEKNVNELPEYQSSRMNEEEYKKLYKKYDVIKKELGKMEDIIIRMRKASPSMKNYLEKIQKSLKPQYKYFRNTEYNIKHWNSEPDNYEKWAYNKLKNINERIDAYIGYVKEVD